MEKVRTDEKDFRYFHRQQMGQVKNSEGEFVPVPIPITEESFEEFIEDIDYYEVKRNGVLKLLCPQFSDQFKNATYKTKEGEIKPLYPMIIQKIKKRALMGISLVFNKDTGDWHYSLCAFPDQFSKKKGRLISRGRLDKHGSAGKRG